MKKLKLSTEVKIAIVAFFIMSFICAIAVGINLLIYGGVAHADGESVVEESTEPSVVVVEKEVEKDDLATVFKNNILPYVVSGAEAGLALLIVLVPYIKKKGQLKALQGAYTVATKTIEAYKAKEGELTVESITTAVVDTLKSFITETVKATIKENVKDTTGDINAIDTKVDVLSAQITNLIKAATLTWGQVDGVPELLAKSPTASVLNGYLAQIKEVKALVQASNADALAPVEALEKELEVYDNADE